MKAKRIDSIREYTQAMGTVSTKELCQKFNVSNNTVRRYIDVLVNEGSVKKVYGGIIAVKNDLQNGLKSYENRDGLSIEGKNRIAEKSASFIKDNDVIYLDSGTTIVKIIKYLSKVKNLTIITASLPIINSLVNYQNIKVIVLPGILNHKTLSFTGSTLTSFLEPFNIDKAFMSCNGISLEKGITNATYEEYEVKKAIVKKSKKVYLLADRSKFDNQGFMTFASISDINNLITDFTPQADFLNLFQEFNIKLVCLDK